jgi:hypothetical protein
VRPDLVHRFDDALATLAPILAERPPAHRSRFLQRRAGFLFLLPTLDACNSLPLATREVATVCRIRCRLGADTSGQRQLLEPVPERIEQQRTRTGW